MSKNIVPIFKENWIIFIMHQSIPAAPCVNGINMFLALDGKFPGVGTLELSNLLGWGRKKRANTPSSVNTATFFIDRTVE